MYEWYYVGQFGQLGPLSLEQMEELIDSGVIMRETYVWKRGMADWVLAGSLHEFSTLLTPTTPPPPPSGPPVRTSQPRGQAGTVTSMSSPPPMHYQVYGSPSSRVLAGLLQILPGVGRMYLGYLAIGVLQLVLTLLTCGIMILWSWVDGIVILAGGVKTDGYGRALAD